LPSLHYWHYYNSVTEIYDATHTQQSVSTLLRHDMLLPAPEKTVAILSRNM
jgi:hypothetical protein